MKYMVFLSVLFLSSSHAYAGDSRHTVYITNGEWPPFLSEHLPHFGYASHVITEAFHSVGIEVEYGFFPWKRSYRYAKNGKDPTGKRWNGTAIWVYTDERAESFHYTDPVVIDEEVLYSLRSKPVQWTQIEDLQGKRIGATLHTVYPPLEAAEKKGVLVLTRAANYDLLFRRLLLGEVDAVPLTKRVALYFLHVSLSSSDRHKITYHPTVIQVRKYHLILSRVLEGNVELVDLFNEGLMRIEANGVLNDLTQKFEAGAYFPPDYESLDEE
ncbi:substrate-binding periplasmic protein [Hahella ganghwensis]|uniref:substrate-binding periplasmic protein n=1 Tax=Hahella ganghwensis TaxID=286420 RepID=UPI00036680C2|nr:transporter substrate-binding domain-containing protein [Hahella ganghwensis]